MLPSMTCKGSQTVTTSSTLQVVDGLLAILVRADRRYDILSFVMDIFGYAVGSPIQLDLDALVS